MEAGWLVLSCWAQCRDLGVVKLSAMGRLKNTFNSYFLPSSFASAEQECVGKQHLLAVFAGGTFCG